MQKLSRKLIQSLISYLQPTFLKIENDQKYSKLYEDIQFFINSGDFFIGRVQRNQHLQGYGLLLNKEEQKQQYGVFQPNQSFNGFTAIQVNVFGNKEICCFEGQIQEPTPQQKVYKGALYQYLKSQNMIYNFNVQDIFYQGQLLNGQLHGKGTLRWGNVEYQGNFVNGFFSTGTFKGQIRQKKYNFTKTIQNTIGRINNSNQNQNQDKKYKYQGQICYQTKLPNGYGILILNDYTYTGFFSNGIKDGNGRIQYTNGDNFQGLWIKNRQIKGSAKFNKFIRFNSNFLQSQQQCSYYGQVKNSIPMGKGTLVSLDGAFTYQGQFSNGKMHGWGKIKIHKSKNQFEGQWKNDQPQDGTGCLYNFRGDGIYIGKMKNMLPQGLGNWQSCQFIYKGQFKLGKRVGNGRIEFKNNCFFQGTWINDCQERGQGVTFEQRYQGELFKERPHGTGTLKMDQGIYIGEFKNGLKNGNGKITFNNDDFLEGQFESNKFVRGYTSCNLKNGCRYQGQMKQLYRQGQGKLTCKNKDVFQGFWNKGNLEGKGKLTYNDGRTYEGEFKNTKKNGQGVYKNCKQQLIYQGNFEDDQYHNKGTLNCIEEGYQYDGNFAKGKKNGDGTFQSKEIKYKGKFIDDQFHGQGSLIKKKENITITGKFQKGKENGFVSIIRTSDRAKLFVGLFKDGLKNGEGQQTNGNQMLQGTWSNGLKHGVFFYRSQNNDGDIIEKEVYYNQDKLIKSQQTKEQSSQEKEITDEVVSLKSNESDNSSYDSDESEE